MGFDTSRIKPEAYNISEDSKSREEESHFIELEAKRINNYSKTQDIIERKKYANLTFQFLCYFSSGLFLLIFLCGVNYNSLQKGFYLSDNVLIALITTSLSTITGVFIFVMKYLFSINNK